MKETLQPAIQGTERSQSNLWDSLWGQKDRLLGFIQKRVKDLEDAEDILQDVFYSYANRSATMPALEQAASWLYAVARNKIADSFRKKKPESFSEQEDRSREEGENWSFADILIDDSQDPEMQLYRSLFLEELADALEELPEKQRQVITLHELEQKSFKEIAKLTGDSVNTLLSRKRYAVLYLRERLQEFYNEMN